MSDKCYCPMCGHIIGDHLGISCCFTCAKIVSRIDAVKYDEAMRIRRRRKAIKTACLIGIIIVVALNAYVVWTSP